MHSQPQHVEFPQIVDEAVDVDSEVDLDTTPLKVGGSSLHSVTRVMAEILGFPS